MQSLRSPDNILRTVRVSFAAAERDYLLLRVSTDEVWPELLSALFSASQSPDAGQRESAFRIFSTTPGIIEKQHEETVQAAFIKGFKDDDVSVGLFGPISRLIF